MPTASLSTGPVIVYDHEGAGGAPLLLLHGWPETRRIWERNVAALADAGFEVIAPDLRGFGDSGLAPDDRYDAAAHSHDAADKVDVNVLGTATAAANQQQPSGNVSVGVTKK